MKYPKRTEMFTKLFQIAFQMDQGHDCSQNDKKAHLAICVIFFLIN